MRERGERDRDRQREPERDLKWNLYLSVFLHSCLKGPSLSSQCSSWNIISLRLTVGPREKPASFIKVWRVEIFGNLHQFRTDISPTEKCSVYNIIIPLKGYSYTRM